ncbi:MAG: serine O-acetyltransferase [bacterium]
MDSTAIDALARHLEPLHGSGGSAPPPSDELLEQTLGALRMLVFAPLRPTGRSGRTIATEVAHGFASLIEQALASTRRSEDGSIFERFVPRVPAIAVRLGSDVRAAYKGDPAAQDELEIMACYPGVRALFVHRFAHELDGLGVPLLPRMMAEFAHRETGIDIHPSANIGDELFIDHGTGVVIGQTAVIGNRCRLYQGVTLGAKSFDRAPDGTLRRGYRRHPTLEDDVTVYAGATILGGDTIIGRGAVVAGGVFLTQSVPPGHLVTGPKLQLRVLSMEAGL